MKTVLSLHNVDLTNDCGINVPEEVRESLYFDRLCIDHELGFWEFHLDIKNQSAAVFLPELRKLLLKAAGNKISRIIFRPRYTIKLSAIQYLDIHWPDISLDINNKSPILSALLEPVKWHDDNGIVVLKVVESAVKKLEQSGVADFIKNSIKETTDVVPKIHITAGDFTSYIDNKIKQHRQAIQETENKRMNAAIKERGKILYSTTGCKHGEVNSIKDIVDSKPIRKKVTISGEVVSYTAPNQRYYSTEKFSLTDFTSTLECIIKSSNGDFNGNGQNNHRPCIKLKAGDWLKVTGILDNSFKDEELKVKVELIERVPRNIRQETSDKHRIELHAHTKMSQMDGLTELSELIERAAFWQHPAVGITDHGNVHAFPDAVALGKKHGVKVLLGMEGYLTNHEDSYVKKFSKRKKDRNYISKGETAKFREKVFHIILYVANQTGLRNLYDLVSLSNTEYFYRKPLIPRNILLKYREGLIIGSACERGEIFQLVLDEHLNKKSSSEFKDKISEAIQLYDYLEIQPVANNNFFISKGLVKSEDELKKMNMRIFEIGKEFSKDVAATGDVHVLDEHDATLRKILQIGQGYDKSEGRAERDASLSFKTTDEMLKEFSYFGDEIAEQLVIHTPAKIAAKIENIKPIPDGFHPPTLEGAAEELKKLCAERCLELYGEAPHPIISGRMHRELDDIINNHFADLYILAQRLVKKSLNDGYIVGSRGSVGSSFVAYLCRITEVNSLSPHYTCPSCFFTEFVNFDEEGKPRNKPLDGIQAAVGVDLTKRKCRKCGEKMKRYGYDIPFETFVGFKGDKTPDIDLNFASEYQSRAHQYIEELFGKDHVFRAGTMSTLQSKTAFGFIKKYLESIHEDWPKAEINRAVSGLTGIKRTTGQHPGGMIILPTNKNITEFCPVQFPANKAESGVRTTHFDYHSMEDQLLKLDILGHDDPTQIRMLCEFTGEDITQIPLDDKDTLSIFSGVKALKLKSKRDKNKVGTLGIPEFGTEFVRGMLADTKPKKFEDLIRISGLSHGTDVWLNNARDLIKNKTATLEDVICTRDDIMHDLMLKDIEPFAAFKIMEKVRKGKGLTSENIKLMKEHKVPEWYIDSCEKIKYMFPKAHAAAYVINAFRIAYCKVHHALAYYASYFTVKRGALNTEVVAGGRDNIKNAIEELLSVGRRNLTANDAGVLDSLEIALEMVERGVVMRQIDIYKSLATKCIIENGEIIPPLTSFAGLGEAAAESIIYERKKEKFSSREDILRRTQCNRTILDNMAKAGVANDIPESDQMQLF